MASLSNTTRRATALLIAAVASALSSESALAHGQFPSPHRAAAYGCYTTSTTGTWTVSSGVQMYRAEGYPAGVAGTGGSTVDPMTGAISGNYWSVTDGFTQQWLYYQVVVGTQLANGSWYWDYGNWIRRRDSLGEHTDGVTTEFQLDNGRWVTTSYSHAGYWNGFAYVASPSDLSFVNRRLLYGGGRKYVYGHMYWEPIYNLARRQVFAGYEHWEPIGYVNCI